MTREKSKLSSYGFYGGHHNLVCILYCGCFSLSCNVWVSICVGFDSCVGVLVICVLVFIGFCIVCTVLF